MRLIQILFVLMVVAAMLAGCGGSGSVTDTAALHYSIYWGERSRSVIAPSSALSAKLELTPATGSTVAMTVNRPDGIEAKLQSYTMSTPVPVGTATMKMTFYANADGAGSVVGIAVGVVKIDATGTGVGTVTTDSAISSVVVQDQTLYTTASADLTVTAYDQKGEIVAVQPGAIFARIDSGSNVVSLSGLTVTGTLKGTAKVVATIDKVASAAATVTVYAKPSVTMIQLPDMQGGSGNAISSDGRIVVGAALMMDDTMQGFLWSESASHYLNPLPGDNAAGAYGLNGNGTLAVGASGKMPEEGEDYPPQPVVWRGGSAAEKLEVPNGYVGGAARAVSGDGTLIGGFLYENNGAMRPCLWLNGDASADTTVFGEVTAVSRDGSTVSGFTVVDPQDQDSPQIAFAADRTLRSRQLGRQGGDVLEYANAITPNGQEIGGGLASAEKPGIWSQPTGTYLLAFGGRQGIFSASADGVFGGGGADLWLAFLYSPQTGARSYANVAAAFRARTGFDLLKPFEDTQTGPVAIFAISDDADSFAGRADSQSSAAVAFKVDMPQWRTMPPAATIPSLPSSGPTSLRGTNRYLPGIYHKPTGKFGFRWL